MDIKLEYYNGITDCKSVYNSFSDNWNGFISGIKVLNYNI